MSECRQRGVDQRLARLRIGDVRADRDRPPARRLHQFPRIGQPILPPRGKHDVRARFGEGLRERNPKARGRARDDRDPTIEAKQIQYGDGVLLPIA